MTVPIGLIGLGLMGSEIAKRLLQAGHGVLGFDLDPNRRIELATAGGQVADENDDVWQQCERVILSLPNDSIAREVLLAATLRSGQLIMDTTTGAPEAASELAENCAQKGIEFVDATISGSSAHLASGQAVILVGATEQGWNEAREILQALASECIHVGPPGAGARMKLVTNLVLGLNRAALAEGLAFAKAQGLDLELTLRLFRATPAYSRIMDTKGEKMIHEEFSPQARLSQHRKDVELMLACAAEHNLCLTLTAAHRELLIAAEQLGYGQQDNSALIKAYDSTNR